MKEMFNIFTLICKILFQSFMQACCMVYYNCANVQIIFRKQAYSATRINLYIMIVLFLQQQGPVHPVNFLAQVTTAPLFWIRIQRLKTGSIGLQSEKRNLKK